MSDVEIFKAELTTASSAVRSATDGVVTAAADLRGEDTGIGNPASRPALRLAVHRHLAALNRAAWAHIVEGSQLAASAQRIADRYTELETELTGRESS
jgi:hypothetical protein